MKQTKPLILAFVIAVSAMCLFSCRPSRRSDTFDRIVLEALEAQANAEEPFTMEGAPDDSLKSAIQKNLSYFDGVYTADGVIWHFYGNGDLDAYDGQGNIQNHSYTLAYSLTNNNDKYIDFSFPEGVKRYRLKKLTKTGFEVVYVDEDGNDVSVFAFTKSPFYEALLNEKPFFTETYYRNNSVWNFEDAGVLTVYDPGGTVLKYMYNLEYSEGEDGPERYLLLCENSGKENESFINLKITAIKSSSFTVVRTRQDETEQEELVFTKQ